MAEHTFSAPPDRPNFPAIEREILKDWTDNKTFERTYREQCEANKEPFVFLDGPPFATGLPHYGHLLAGSIKDAVCRYQCLKGKKVERRFGWDTHGLPIEFEIDKQEGITTRDQVIGPEGIGIPAYNEKCRAIVMRYANEWERTVKRSGRWIDFDNDYKTMNLPFMETCWWVFGELFKKGLVYEDFKVMPYSTACATPLSNFEASQNYKDVPDPAIIVSFPCVEKEGLTFLAWTTTPWTLPMNLALCLKGSFNYVEFSKKSDEKTVYVCGESRLPYVAKLLGIKAPKNWPAEDYEASPDLVVVRRSVKGSEYKGLTYTPLFQDFPASAEWKKTGYRILNDDYVTDDAGTGIVHQAPAHGEDDHRVCMAAGILVKGGGIYCPLDFNCRYTEEAPKEVALLGVCCKEADNDICKYLKTQNRMLSKNTEVHSYPFCWRSDTPLIYRTVPSWFINVEKIKPEVVENNKKIHWVPEHVGKGRFHNWLAGATDWCVSRNRFWGTPMPIWRSEDGKEIKCISSVEELKACMVGDREITDIHRHHVDDILVKDPRGDAFPPMKRIDEVFDCWFESGSMPYAQIHYPFEDVNEEQFLDQLFPGDFIAEGIDQTRGWFYTLIVLSTALFNRPAFKNVIVNGIVLAEDGKKMSKRLQNYPDPNELIEELGADAMRLFLLSSPVVCGESIKFSQKSVQETLKSSVLPLFHGYRFFVQEASRYEYVTGKAFVYDAGAVANHPKKNMLDKWILAATNKLNADYAQDMADFRLYSVGPRIVAFLESLTNFYVRLNRDRMKGGSGQEDAYCALQCTFYVILNVVIFMSPFTPFISDHIYQNLKKALPKEEQSGTVHEVSFPEVDETFFDEKLLKAQQCLSQAISMGRVMREQQKVPLKTPLKECTVIQTDPELFDALSSLKAYLAEELNCIDVTVISDPAAVSYKAMCNLKNLGRKLGKSMPAVRKVVDSWDNAAIAAYQKDGATVEGFMLEGDDVIIKCIAKESEDPLEFVDACPVTSTVLRANFEINDELRALAMIREVCNRLQKLRKSSGLKVEDDDVVMTCSGTGLVGEVLAERLEAIGKQIRRPDQLFLSGASEAAALKEIASETFDIHGDELKLVYFR